MEMNQKKNFIINFIYYSIMAVIFFVLFKYLAPILVPFFIAFGIAFVLNKPISYLSSKINVKKKAIGIIVLIGFYAVIGTLILLLSGWVISLLGELITHIPAVYSNVIEPLINELYKTLKSFNRSLAPSMQSVLNSALNTVIDLLKQFFTSLSSLLVMFITAIISATPNTVISVVLTIIASFFFVSDYDGVINYIKSHMSDKVAKFMNSINYFMKDKLVIIVKSYIIIMTLTFVELLIGLSLLGVDKAIMLAFTIAILDIMPVLGTGAVMLPWMIVSLIKGNYVLGIGLLVLYLVITVIRNIIEPKLVGAELGLHPIVTLASMLVGGRLFGFMGLFGLPISISFILYYIENNKKA